MMIIIALLYPWITRSVHWLGLTLVKDYAISRGSTYNIWNLRKSLPSNEGSSHKSWGFMFNDATLLVHEKQAT